MASVRRIFGVCAIPAMAVLVIQVLTALGCTGGPSKTEEATSDWSSRLDIHLEQGEDELVLVLEGVSGWFVNALYPGISVTFEAPDEETSELLGRIDVRFEGRSGEDKAKRAVFPVPKERGKGSGPLRGTYRSVVCTDDVCSPPFSGEFSLPLRTP